ncbi:MAG: hypothetical protein K0U72_14720 [Gammaproteobacteria bacterium]|nr:hypothetical protein [Gammaproteobacteria bacterium]
MSSRRILAAVLTILFGSIPATFIAALPATAIGMGFLGLFSRVQVSDLPPILTLIVWGFAGIYGVVALWLTPFFHRFAFVRTGLVFGLLAIAPASIMVFLTLSWTSINSLAPTWESISGIGFVTVPIVAIGWLYYFARWETGLDYLNS